MAKLECTLHTTFDAALRHITDDILAGSVSATLEDSGDFHLDGVRCSVRVFERYSYAGSNRVSMNVTLFGTDGHIQLCAITSGGSQAMFWKVNTLGEEAFLDKLREIVQTL